MKMCFIWHPWQIFCEYWHSIPLTNVVMTLLSAWVFGGFFSPPSLLVVDMSIPDILMLHSSLPDIHLFKYNWISLYIIGVSGREKQFGNFNKTDADFIVSSEVYELLLTRICLPQITCCRAGRERTGVLPFPGSAAGENEQETPMKAVLIQEKTRIEKWEHWKVPPKNQYCHLWTW